MITDSKNIIITGIPRSGTTLLTALIDSIPNAAALNEPSWQSGSVLQNRQNATSQDFAKWLIGDFIDIRMKLLKGIPLPERRGSKGEAVTNYYNRSNGRVENRYSIVNFTRDHLTEDFTLAVKQIGPYLGILGALAELNWFRIVAVVRNPIYVISSWRSLNIPPTYGKLPGAVHWEAMQQLTNSSIPLLEKQVKMYDLMCKRLYNLKSKINVIKYEELLSSQLHLAEILCLNKDTMYDTTLIKPSAYYRNEKEEEIIHEAVLAYGEHLFHFYPELR